MMTEDDAGTHQAAFSETYIPACFHVIHVNVRMYQINRPATVTGENLIGLFHLAGRTVHVTKEIQFISLAQTGKHGRLPQEWMPVPVRPGRIPRTQHDALNRKYGSPAIHGVDQLEHQRIGETVYDQFLHAPE
jgi:hypothetical protein